MIIICQILPCHTDKVVIVKSFLASNRLNFINKNTSVLALLFKALPHSYNIHLILNYCKELFLSQTLKTLLLLLSVCIMCVHIFHSIVLSSFKESAALLPVHLSCFCLVRCCWRCACPQSLQVDVMLEFLLVCFLFCFLFFFQRDLWKTCIRI